MNYTDVISALDHCGQHTIKPGLTRMQEACALLGNPERLMKCVHVAGTNGKGSTIAFLESILRANGCTVGRYISPHIHDLRERVTTNGTLISEADFVRAFECVQKNCADLQPSYFEYLTLMTFVHFSENPVDVVLLETGMGGRWDATNVVTPLLSIITRIDYDHQTYLGDTLSQIAAEKCGILKKNVPAIIAPQAPEAMDVIQNVVAELGIHAQIVPPLPEDVPLGLSGEHQRQNAALAVAAARLLFPSPSGGGLGRGGSAIQQGDLYTALSTTRWPGRLEWISKVPPILCDVAHNPGGMRVLVDYMRQRFPSPSGGGLGRGGSKSELPPHPGPLPKGEGISCLLGVMADKDAAGMVKTLAEIADTFFCVTPNTPRALPAENLAKIVRAAGKTAHVAIIADVKSAWKGPGLLVVTGSFYTVGEFEATC